MVTKTESSRENDRVKCAIEVIVPDEFRVQVQVDPQNMVRITVAVASRKLHYSYLQL
jgi:hypothetical protein